jgi:hypothetical protein
MSVTLAELRAHEAEQERLDEALERMAVELADIRGKPVNKLLHGRYPTKFEFDSWELWSDGSVTVSFEWSMQGGNEYTSVSIPAKYLDGTVIDWRAVETQLVAEDKAFMLAAEERKHENAMRNLV